MLNFFRDYN